MNSGITISLLAALALSLGTYVQAEESSKTTLCHKPDGKHPVSIRIETLDVPEHLANHGDYIGLCPTEVGADGATISIPGEIEIHIPAGSITEPMDIYVKRISGEPGSFDVLYELGPDGFASDEPIEITIAYDPSQLPPAVQEIDLLMADFTERMQPLEDSVVDTGSKTVSGTVTHFSLYGMGALTSTGVNVNQFGSISDSWRMPIGDYFGADVGNELSLLSISAFSNYNYPRISFNESGDPNDWYVATAFNNDRWLNNGFSEPSIGSASLYSSRGSYHPGEDWNIIQGEDRNQVVRAIADGIVLFSQAQNSSFGNIVILGHKLDSGEIVGSVYAHMLNAPTVSPGLPVSKGAEIGRIGSAPSNAPHLHFEIVHESLLKVDGNGYIRIPVNETLNRGWYWPGTDTRFIGSNYYSPSEFLRDRRVQNGPVLGTALGKVTNVLTTGGALVPGGIDVGSTVKVIFRYDPQEAQITTFPPNDDVLYILPNGLVRFEINGLVWDYPYADINVANNYPNPNLGPVDIFNVRGFTFRREPLNFPGSIRNDWNPLGFGEYIRFALVGSSGMLNSSALPVSHDEFDLGQLLYSDGRITTGDRSDQYWEIRFSLNANPFIFILD